MTSSCILPGHAAPTAPAQVEGFSMQVMTLPAGGDGRQLCVLVGGGDVAEADAALVPVLAFTTRPSLAVAGMLAWGAVLGIQESTMRAAVADLIPPARRGTACGVFAAGFGAAPSSAACSLALYDHFATALIHRRGHPGRRADPVPGRPNQPQLERRLEPSAQRNGVPQRRF